MQIAATFSFNNGIKEVTRRYPDLLTEVNAVIKSIDVDRYKTKKSKEKTMMDEMLYSLRSINHAFKKAFSRFKGWSPVRVSCEYSAEHYAQNYSVRRTSKGAFREMDFVKKKLGVEVQFGKYSFMVYNVCAKMTIFKNLGHIEHGIEIVPVKSLVSQMSSGVSYFEQFVWDLEVRGVSNIDIPVMILGIDAD